MRLFKKEFNLDLPEQKPVTSRWTTSLLNNRLLPVKSQSFFHYVSLRGQLTALFSNEQFRGLYYSEKSSADGYIRSHRDGLHFKNHPLFSNDHFAIRIQLFNEDLEVCNPCDSKTKVHQLSMFNFVIFIIPPVLNSLLSNIHTCAVCRTLDVQDLNFGFVLSCFMEEIQELESDVGMKLSVPGLGDIYIRWTIVGFCGDTKGAHEIGGFMSLSANKFCRLCLIDRSEINFKSHYTE